MYRISILFKRGTSFTAAVIGFVIWTLSPLSPVLRSAFAQGVESRNTDLVFLIDNSGSMKQNDPGFMTPRIVRTFISELSLDNNVSIILFDGKARRLMPLTALSDNRMADAIDEALSHIDYRGQHTNTPQGIERALYELRADGREKSQKGIILITDGIVDTGDPAKDRELTRWLKEDLTRQSRELGIRIFGIAFTDAADFSLIQTLATRTGGNYFRTYEVQQISPVLKEIQADLVPPADSAQPRRDMAGADRDTGQAISGKPALHPPPHPAPAGDTMVVVDKGSWMIIPLAIIIALVIGAVLALFLIIQYGKRHTVLPVPPEKKVNIPEAHLEDVNHVCHTPDGKLKIEKALTKIGRGKGNDMVMEQPAISGFHATIEYRNLSFYLEDQRSTNGTGLNGRRLAPNEPVRLKSGDHITFAKVPFNFFIANANPFGDTVMLSMTALTEKDAEATIILDLDNTDSKQGLIACLQSHLIQIHELGLKYREYVNTYFAHETLDLLAGAAYDNLLYTQTDGEQHCTPVIKKGSYYLICSLPVAISDAAEFFGRRDNGFSQFVLKWLKSEPYQTAKCEQLCIITFGQEPATWVSITIVPTHSKPDPVEIMSVDFLNDEEKASMALDFDHHGRVI